MFYCCTLRFTKLKMGHLFITSFYGIMKLAQLLLSFFLSISVLPTKVLTNGSAISVAGVTVGFIFFLGSLFSICCAFSCREKRMKMKFIIFEIIMLAVLVLVWLILYIASVRKYNMISDFFEIYLIVDQDGNVTVDLTGNKALKFKSNKLKFDYSLASEKYISLGSLQALQDVDFVYDMGCSLITSLMVYQIVFVLVLVVEKLQPPKVREESASTSDDPSGSTTPSGSTVPLQETRRRSRTRSAVEVSRSAVEVSPEINSDLAGDDPALNDLPDSGRRRRATDSDSMKATDSGSLNPIFDSNDGSNCSTFETVSGKSSRESLVPSTSSARPLIVSSESSLDHPTTASTMSLRESPSAENLRKSPSARSLRESPSAKSLRESPSTRSLRESPSAMALRESPSAMALRESPSAMALRESPSVRPKRESPTARSLRESPSARSLDESSSPRSSKSLKDSPSAGSLRESPPTKRLGDSPVARTSRQNLAPPKSASAELDPEASPTKSDIVTFKTGGNDQEEGMIIITPDKVSYICETPEKSPKRTSDIEDEAKKSAKKRIL